MKLHGFWRSTATWRVRIALAYKQIEHVVEPVALHSGAHHSPEYRSLNPMAQVPALVVEDGVVLSQSIAILEYLEERYPAPPLLPAAPLARARVRQLTEVINSGIQPLQNTSVQRHLESLGVDVRAWLQRYVGEGLAAFEQLARPLAGRFCVGDALSFADLVLVPELYFARRFGVAVEGFSTLLRIEEACAAMACFQTAHAERQPDTPAG